MKPNDILTLDIEAIGDDGDGIATLGHTTIYVSNALPGERVRAIVADVAKSYAHADLDKVLRYVQSDSCEFCQHYKECGGCQIQRMEYRAQLALKRETVIQHLESAGVSIDNNLPATIGCKYQKGFRNKAIFPLPKMLRERWLRVFMRDGRTTLSLPQNVPWAYKKTSR